MGILISTGILRCLSGNKDREDPEPPLNLFLRPQILPTAIALAMVALIEQLMTVEVVNEMTKSRCNSGREAFGLGVANVIAGLLGGMGGNAMIAHSMLQVAAGGKYRIANIIVGVRQQ